MSKAHKERQNLHVFWVKMIDIHRKTGKDASKCETSNCFFCKLPYIGYYSSYTGRKKFYPLLINVAKT